MTQNEQQIRIDDGLRHALEGRMEPVSTVVNLIAERYMAMIAHARKSAAATTVREDDVFRKVLEELGTRRIGTHEIEAFPSLVEDWLRRHPGYPKSALFVIEGASFFELVAQIDRVERLGPK
jgi:hypothetical protein